MLHIEIKSLCFFTLASSLFLRLTLELLKSLFHENNRSLRLHTTTFVDGTIRSFHILDVLVTLRFERLRVLEVGLEFLDDTDNIYKVTNGHVRLPAVCLVSPFGTDAADAFRLVHFLVTGKDYGVCVSMND